MKTKAIKIYLSTLTKLRRVFPAMRNETMPSYFQRLADWINIELEGGRASKNEM